MEKQVSTKKVNSKVVGLYIKRIILGFLAFEFLFLLIGLFIRLDKGSQATPLAKPTDFTMLNDGIDKKFTIHPSSFLGASSLTENNYGYSENVYDFIDESIHFVGDVDKTGTYLMYVDYYSTNETIEDNLIGLTINDVTSDLFQNVMLNTSWVSNTTEEQFDIYNNQVSPQQESANIWATVALYDQQFLNPYPLFLELNEGENKIEITKSSGSFLLGCIYLVKFDGEYQSYEEYQQSNASKTQEDTKKSVFTIEAEDPWTRSDPVIGTQAVAESHMTPFSTKKNYRNALSGDSFNQSGYSVTYGFEVETPGFYEITLKYYISQTNSNTYGRILIDNEVPFENLNSYKFEAKSKYSNLTLNDKETGDYQFYFEKGVHTITIMLDASHQKAIYEEINALISEINVLYLEVMKLTNGNVDENKSWIIDDYIPDATARLNDFQDRLATLLDLIEDYSKSNKKATNRLYQQIENAYEKMKKLTKNPNKLPTQLSILSEGNSSVSKMLSSSIHTSIFSPISIDKIYVHGSDAKISKASSNLFLNQISTAQRIVKSGVNVKDDEDTIHIWVNRSTYYVSLMQQFADAYYTPTHNGQRIRFSLLPDESKLIYANASGTIPDAAFGVTSSVPYDLGLRGALVDMRSLDGFGTLIDNIKPGAFLNTIVDDKVYGIPETMDFQVTFYRKDLLDEFGIAVPNTYEELTKETLTKLQTYGMNYYIPMASGSGLKGISMTAPFIYQYGGDIYSTDCLSAAIDSSSAIQAINMMVDLFTIYSLPVTAQNFYQSFRDGNIPVGISGFDTYLQISQAAPEIQGKWDIALPLGVEQEDGTINRTNTGAGRDIVMFNKSKKQTATWDFIKWWMGTDIQTDFATAITQTYGATYLWNTANYHAFENLALPQRHKDIILEQWDSTITIPQIPATYIVERGISDIWNDAVFNQKPVRSSISDMNIEMNNEITRKMIEFGYLDSKGKVVKEYHLPTVDEVLSWRTEVKQE